MSGIFKRHTFAAALIAPMIAACAGDDSAADSAAADSAAQGSAAGAMATGSSTAGGDQGVVQFLGTVNSAEIQAARLAITKARNADVKAFAQRMIDEHTRGMQMLSDMANRNSWAMPDTMVSNVQGPAAAGTTSPGGSQATGGQGNTGGGQATGAQGTTGAAGTTGQGGSQPGSGTTPGASQSGSGQVAGGDAINAAIATLRTQHQSAMQQLQSASGAAFDSAYMNSQVTAHQQVLDMLRQFGPQAQNTDLRTHVNEAETMVQDHLRRAQELQNRPRT